MKILVTGGSGVIGAGVIPELLRRDHRVRLLSRHADVDAKQWSAIEPFAGDVSDAASIDGAADGCDAVLHIAGIAVEHPPDATFEKVNVDGTRNILAEAARAQVRRFVFVSSLGADYGTSAYHRSKREAERLVEAAPLAWTIVRPGGVYGPGDEVISFILKLIRALPVLTVVDDGNQLFQPIFYEDLGRALAEVLERDLSRQTLEVAGGETTSMNDLIDRLGKITGREPRVVVNVPSTLASIASKVLDLPIDENKLAMLREENVIRGTNALTDVLGLTPTPLDDGLRSLAQNALPEQLPEDGVGAMHHKHFEATLHGTTKSPEDVMEVLREKIGDIMPIDFAAEPESESRLDLGNTLTGSLPVRGNFQVRVEKVEPRRVTLATIEGHPIAGTVQFSTEEAKDGVGFAIDIDSRAANFFDFVTLRSFGEIAQDANWRAVIRRLADECGATVEHIESAKKKLSDDEAKKREAEAREMVSKRAK
jgi:nucleoside-diphosphate-sugar epimerase